MVGSWLPHGDMLSVANWATVLGSPVLGFRLRSLGFCSVGGGMTPKGYGVPEEGTGK